MNTQVHYLIMFFMSSKLSLYMPEFIMNYLIVLMPIYHL